MEQQTTYVAFGPQKTPYHRNLGRWLNRPTVGAAELNFVHRLGMVVQKVLDGEGIAPGDIVTLMSLCRFHTTIVSARATLGHWKQQREPKCLRFNVHGRLIGGTQVPRPDYLEFGYGAGPKRWKRKGMNKKVHVDATPH